MSGDGQAGDERDAPVARETVQLLEDDDARMMDEVAARRRESAGAETLHSDLDLGFYESALHVLGAYVDQEQPRDVFFFEQEGAYVIRLLMSTRTGARHVLAEFTADELRQMVDEASHWRGTTGRQPR